VPESFSSEENEVVLLSDGDVSTGSGALSEVLLRRLKLLSVVSGVRRASVQERERRPDIVLDIHGEAIIDPLTIFLTSKASTLTLSCTLVLFSSRMSPLQPCFTALRKFSV
jgi:hypothetical protein